MSRVPPTGVSGPTASEPQREAPRQVEEPPAPFLRIAEGPGGYPLVHVRAVAVGRVDASDELLACLNDINSDLHFARIFWTDEQVVIESEVPGSSLSFDWLHRSYETVGAAAGFYGPRLAEEFVRPPVLACTASGTSIPIHWDGYL